MNPDGVICRSWLGIGRSSWLFDARPVAAIRGSRQGTDPRAALPKHTPLATWRLSFRIHHRVMSSPERSRTKSEFILGIILSRTRVLVCAIATLSFLVQLLMYTNYCLTLKSNAPMARTLSGNWGIASPREGTGSISYH